MDLYAVVRIRGRVGVDARIRDTLKLLRLERPNHCVVVPKNPSYEGMLKKAQNYVTWGEISEDMLKKLVFKRGRYEGDKRLGRDEAEKIAKIILEKGMKAAPIKPVFRLSPPSGGYKSVKLLYPKGDAGYRGEKINDLLKRMI